MSQIAQRFGAFGVILIAAAGGAGTGSSTQQGTLPPQYGPRAVTDTASDAVTGDWAYTLLPNTMVEGEALGENPELGLFVQDMTSFGTSWSANKQLFWKPGADSFEWQFKDRTARTIKLDLTAAPDYGSMTISLHCVRRMPPYYGKVMWLTLATVSFDGYAPSVQRKRVEMTKPAGSICDPPGIHKLVFKLTATAPDRRYGGIDRFWITK
jgi:hypothetical protein